MRPRASILTATLLLAICLVCQVAEIFDRWDHTLQTGDDTEYALVVLALCVGIAYSLKWILPELAFPASPAKAASFILAKSSFPELIHSSLDTSIPASPPPTALRI